MILIIPDNINQIKDNYNYYDGVILSIKDYSVNSLYTIELNDLKKIIPLLNNKEIFISINKNIENSEINNIEKLLLELNNYPIKAVLYSDPAIVTYKEKLNYDLVWAQEHLVTNYETVNFWKNFGVFYAYLSSDITKEEIIEIKNNSESKILVNLFGYLPMFVSKRHIVDNYLKHFNLNDNSKINYITKEGKTYPIIDSNYTYVFSNYIYNGIKEYFSIDPDYYVCNGLLIDNDKFSKVLKVINKISLDNIKDCSLEIDKLFDNTDSSCLYKQTVSKVKK